MTVFPPAHFIGLPRPPVFEPLPTHMTCEVYLTQPNRHFPQVKEHCGYLATHLGLLDGRKIPLCHRHTAAYDEMAGREQWPLAEPISPVVHGGI